MAREINKNFRNLLYLIFFSLLFLSLTSCYPFFKYPLPQLPNSKTDPNITGAWILTTHTSQQYYMFIFPRKTGWFDLLFFSNTDFEESPNGNVSIMEGYSTSVNDQKFLCLRLHQIDSSDPNIGKERQLPFLIVNYETPSSNELNIKLFSEEKIKNLIKDSKLKGEIVAEDALEDDILGLLFKGVFSFETVYITASPDELKQTIAKEGINAFLATASDEITKMFSELGIGSFVGQDEIFVMTFKKAIIEEKK